jgi:hypothetical protein
VYRINALLSELLVDVPVGTNLSLYYMFWTFISGRLLSSRGGVFPALSAFGLSDRAVRRCGAALRTGVWTITHLIERFSQQVAQEGRWQPRSHGGYRPVVGDITAFRRPTLKGCRTKHYFSFAGKALPAIPLGLIASVGTVGDQRRALPRAFVRAQSDLSFSGTGAGTEPGTPVSGSPSKSASEASRPEDESETALRKRLLAVAKEGMALEEALVLDRGFPLLELVEAGLDRWVVRLPTNFTARRATPPVYSGMGRPPTQGKIVRPLSRVYKGHEIPATAPDRTETWTLPIEDSSGETGIDLRADYWTDLVPREAPATTEMTKSPTTEMTKSPTTEMTKSPTTEMTKSPTTEMTKSPTTEIEREGRTERMGTEASVSPLRFQVVAIYDPRFAEPLLLASPLPLSADHLRRLYLDRWPIEGLPLVAKVLLGAGRQFVSAKESRWRLPELALLAGAVLSYLAATEPAVPTGFWDRHPKPTAGRLRRVLASVTFEHLGEIPGQLRIKNSPTDHLPKGFLAHQRRKPSWDDPSPLPRAA